MCKWLYPKRLPDQCPESWLLNRCLAPPMEPKTVVLQMHYDQIMTADSSCKSSKPNCSSQPRCVRCNPLQGLHGSTCQDCSSNQCMYLRKYFKWKQMHTNITNVSSTSVSALLLSFSCSFLWSRLLNQWQDFIIWHTHTQPCIWLINLDVVLFKSGSCPSIALTG